MSDRKGDIFTRQTESIRFHVARDEVRWTDRHAVPERDAERVVNFGCGVQFVPHLMVETIAVCEGLGVEVQGVVGPQFCCGQPYRGGDTDGSGDNMADNSFKRMATLRPLQMIQWCGAAQVQFGKRADPESTEVLHQTAFLARRVEELGERAPWRRAIDARVLVHRKSQDPMPFPDRGPVMQSYDMIPAMLARIPGVRVVGEVRDLPSVLPCEGGIDRLDERGLALARAELARRAQEAGADRVVTEHHQCLREWGKLATDSLPVQHYISVLAEALDVAQPDRFHAHWNANPGERVAQARPEWSTWDMTDDEARAIAARLYPSGNVQPVAAATQVSQAAGTTGSAPDLPRDGERERH